MKNAFSISQIGICVLLIFGTLAEGKAQQQTMVWNAFNMGLTLTDRLDGRIAYLRSTKLSETGLRNNFNWYQMRLGYQVNKNWSVRTGLVWMHLPKSGRTTRRLQASAFHRIKLDKRFVLKNGVRVEAHRHETRFDQRVILMSRLGLRKRMKFLGIAPSVNYSLFYNIGGDAIRYFNETGEQVAQNAAEGLQRGRMVVNLNVKLSQPLRLSVYYMNNHEFNFLSKETQKINVLNPNTGRVQRPFNNFQVVGMSLSYQLNERNLLPINL